MINLKLTIYNLIAMIKNYLKIAIRNLQKYKGFAFINIAGITLGITGCLLIGLFVWDEMQYDKSVPNAENICRLYEIRKDNNGSTNAACTPPAFATFIKEHYPEVAATARILMTSDKFLVENGDKKNYEEKGLLVDSTFFQVFQLPFLKGNPLKAYPATNTIVLSQAIAQKYFGAENPVGKNIKINKSDYAVTGVFAKLPDHFHIDFNYLISLSSAGLPKERMERWTWNQFYTYVKLNPGTNVQQLQNKFQAYVQKEIHPTLTPESATFLPVFQPLKDIHLQSADFIFDNAIRGNGTYVKALSIIAIFVLIIACFNFINLSTARSFRRAKEIGVRKVVGAERKQLVLQFLSETWLLSLIAMLAAVAATYLLLPALNQFTGKSIVFNPFFNPVLMIVLLTGGLLIGLLAGLYPAFILSGFDPVKVLKNMKVTAHGGTAWLRHSLVVLQFSLSALLIVSAIIVYKQTQYLNNKDLGFNKEQVVYFQLRDNAEKNIETFKTALKKIPGVMNVTSGYGLPGDQFAGDGIMVPAGGTNKEYPASVFIGDYDYIKTLGLRVIAGRDFSKDMSTDVREAFIINETAVKELGLGTPAKAIGQPLSWNEWEPLDTASPIKKGKVIGVVQDFHYKSLHEKVAASVIQLYPQINYKVALKIKTGDIGNTIIAVTAEWNKFSPAYPIDYKFMDETYEAMYKSEDKLSSLLWIFTLTAIIVGCMGLFGLATFHAEQKTKEIGIRKVLGASLSNIIGLLSFNFLRMVLIASLIAFPIAWWAMNKWLQDYSYRVTIDGWTFIVAAAAIILIALITVGTQAIKAAITNPVKSLRTE